MEAAEAAVEKHLAKAGQHDTTIHETIAPAVTLENVTVKQHDEVQTVIDRDIHQDHYVTAVQPVKDRQVLAPQIIHQTAEPVVRHFYHDHDGSVRQGAETTWPTMGLVDLQSKSSKASSAATAASSSKAPSSTSTENMTSDDKALNSTTEGLTDMSIHNAAQNHQNIASNGHQSGTVTLGGTETRRSYPLATGETTSSTLRPTNPTAAASTTAINGGIEGKPQPSGPNPYAANNPANPLSSIPKQTSTASPAAPGRTSNVRSSIDAHPPRESTSGLRKSIDDRKSRDYGRSRISVDGRKSRDLGSRTSHDSGSGGDRHKEGLLSKIKSKITGHD